jgi:hypothetical protein
MPPGTPWERSNRNPPVSDVLMPNDEEGTREPLVLWIVPGSRTTLQKLNLQALEVERVAC